MAAVGAPRYSREQPARVRPPEATLRPEPERNSGAPPGRLVAPIRPAPPPALPEQAPASVLPPAASARAWVVRLPVAELARTGRSGSELGLSAAPACRAPASPGERVGAPGIDWPQVLGWG